MVKFLAHCGSGANLKHIGKMQKPLCNSSFADSGFGLHHCQDMHKHTRTYTLTTPKKPARSTASFLARLRTWSVFSVYELTSDSSLPKALTVRMLLIRSSANYTHTFTRISILTTGN